MEQDKLKFKTIIVDSAKYKTLISVKYERQKKYNLPDPSMLKSFLPGKILNIAVKKGDKVKKGTELFTLEAMKMENIIRSTVNGTITKINVEKGSIVPKNEVIMEFELEEE